MKNKKEPIRMKCTCQCHALENFGYDKDSCPHCRPLKQEKCKGMHQLNSEGKKCLVCGKNFPRLLKQEKIDKDLFFKLAEAMPEWFEVKGKHKTFYVNRAAKFFSTLLQAREDEWELKVREF